MSAAGGVTPIRDPAQVAYTLAYELDAIAANLPTKDIAPRYTLQPKTRAELDRAIKLLQEATRLMKRAVKREAPRYEVHCEEDEDSIRH